MINLPNPSSGLEALLATFESGDVLCSLTVLSWRERIDAVYHVIQSVRIKQILLKS